MFAISLLLTLAAPGALPPRSQPVAVVRARIISGVRVDFSDARKAPAGAVIRGRLVEFH